MNEDPKPALAPLARTLFGWALAQTRVLPMAIALGAIGVLTIVDELVRDRQALNLPYESTPAFYAILGFGTVAVALAVAYLFRLVFTNLPAPDDEAP